MQKNIVVRLRGGLGNQMFQYATARSLSLKTGVKLELDSSELGKSGQRALGLNYFNLPTEIRVNNSVLSKYIRRLSITRTSFRERKFGFDEKFKLLRGPVDLVGYFQSEKYFVEHRQDILRDFTLKEEYMENIKALSEKHLPLDSAISLHVRRGDYTNNKNIGLYAQLGDQYYNQAINLIKQKTSGAHTLCVFTDDVNWVTKNLNLPQGSKIISQYTHSDIEDLMLMSQCSHHIIANSTFSWWAAWLNPSATKVVIAPRQWFGASKSTIDTSDLIPATWEIC